MLKQSISNENKFFSVSPSHEIVDISEMTFPIQPENYNFGITDHKWNFEFYSNQLLVKAFKYFSNGLPLRYEWEKSVIVS
jgi:hypothetical protein